MRKVILSVSVIAIGFCIGGCDSKKQQDQAIADQLVTDAKELQSEIDIKMIEQLDSGEGISPDVGQVDNVATMFEEAAAKSSPEQAQVLLDRAETLRQVQALIAPYQTTLAEFTELGGLDATTINELAQFDRRLELVEQLDTLNDKMDQELPALIRKMDENTGSAQLEQKMEYIKQIRQTDREMFRSMKGYLLVLQQLWDQYGVDTDRSIMFSPEVSVGIIEEFNTHAENIQKMTAKQARLQRALVELDSP